ncbi:hypothetical protein K440DRAFT_84555 [Wilcoxina mikolae CBS 423.85]|nr:hypothetical protein K440DRAFT_84555 [Wilcoxina mikolae CBS 423.85]
MATPNSNTSLGMSPATKGGMGKGMNSLPRTPNPNSPRHIFDSSMFLIDPSAQNTVSQPYKPAIPPMSPHRRTKNGVSTQSPSLHYSSSSPASTDAISDSNSSYNTSSYLDPRSSSSPSAHDMTNGISGNTTPGFETLEDLPELQDIGNDLFNRINSLPTVNLPEPEDESNGPPPNSAGYPPSPRLTVSPHPSPKVTISRSLACNTSPVVKIEHSTPENHQSPYSHHRSSSSSSSGLAGDNTTIRRGDDGLWHGGIDPSARGDEYLPFSLKDQEFERLKQAKNADVEEWLRKSSEQLPRQPISGGLAAPKDGRRRAKSVSDFRASQAFVDGKAIGPVGSGDGNVNQVVIDDPDDDEDDDSSVGTVDSAWQEGSLDDPSPNGVKELPPSQADLEMTTELDPEKDPALLPRPGQFFSSHPWNDIAAPVSRGATMAHRNQPGSSNAAIMKFYRCAENIETASRVATFGSNMTKGRRNSAGDADKILPGPLKRLSFGRDKDKDKNKAGTPSRRPSIWGGFRSGLKRSLSNSGDKDKEKDKDKLQSPVDRRKRGSSFSSIGASSSPFKPGILGPAFGQPSLHVETSSVSNIGSAIASMTSPLMATGAGANRTTPGGFGEVINRVRRSRSRSDLQRKHIFGVVTSIVSPALPSSPPDGEVTPGIKKKFTFGEESQKRGAAQAAKLLSPDSAHRHADDDEEMDDGDFSPASARTPGGTKAQLPKHEITPTLDGFAENIRVLAPGLSQKLVDRIGHEQCKRFKKLVDHRHKHLGALKANGCCPNGAKCRKVFGAIGVGSDGVVGITGHKRGNSRFGGGDDIDYSSDENHHASSGDGNVAAAQFPPGVPTPPVARLPAEFECPICFKPKKFNKPSDWTKHVHEDVQPFTCTFPDCTEPKSFKRKADWVRHENERHRHLEWWTCNQPDCTHTCYRKDNFVQHLVREHKMPEPKVKTQKAAGKKNGDTSRPGVDRVWQIVDSCHQETTAQPSSEKCRFCGQSCSTWKKLTVHLARHMEGISLPT